MSVAIQERVSGVVNTTSNASNRDSASNLANLSKDEVIARADSFNHLGKDLAGQGDYEKALVFFLKALEIRESILVQDHRDIVASYNNIGNILFMQGNYDASLECFREATMRMKDYEKHPSIPLVHNSIGLVLSKTGDYKGSMHHFREALRTSLTENDPNTATIYYNMGCVLHKNLGRQAEALKSLENALRIRELVIDQKHELVALCHLSIGKVHFRTKKYNLALESFLKGLDIQEVALGHNHPETALTLANIGVVLMRKENPDYDEAIAYFGLALKIQESVLGSHPDTALSYFNLGFARAHKGDKYGALSSCILAMEIQEKVLGKDHPRTKATFAAIFKIETNNANLDPTFFYTSEEQLRLISESDSSPWDGLEE